MERHTNKKDRGLSKGGGKRRKKRCLEERIQRNRDQKEERLNLENTGEKGKTCSRKTFKKKDSFSLKKKKKRQERMGNLTGGERTKKKKNTAIRKDPMRKGRSR